MQKNVQQNNFVDIYELGYVIELKTRIRIHPLNDGDCTNFSR